MVKVLQIVPSLNYCGGVENYLMNYYKNIDSDIVSFDFAYHIESDNNFKSDISSKSKVFKLPTFSINNYSSIKKQINKIFQENKYDIIHCHMANAAFLYFKVAKKYGVKYRILHSHQAAAADKLTHKIRNIPLLFLGKKRSTHFFACSKLAGDYLFKNKKYFVINNAITIEKFKYNLISRNIIRNQLNISDSTFCIGHIGRMCNQKNQLFLLDIFNEFVKENNNSVLIMIGDGELREEIENKIQQYNLNEKVKLVGVVNNSFDYYNAFDCFILPSLYEGLPVVGIEAQINGLKLLVSDTITKELDFTQNVKFISLVKGIKEWTSALSDNIGISRFDVESSKYNIMEQSKVLENYYVQIVKGNI